MQNNVQLISLNNDEMLNINGGNDGGPSKDTSFAQDVAWFLGATARCIYQFTQTAASYQASLPPSLKK